MSSCMTHSLCTNLHNGSDRARKTLGCKFTNSGQELWCPVREVLPSRFRHRDVKQQAASRLSELQLEIDSKPAKTASAPQTRFPEQTPKPFRPAQCAEAVGHYFPLLSYSARHDRRKAYRSPCVTAWRKQHLVLAPHISVPPLFRAAIQNGQSTKR